MIVRSLKELYCIVDMLISTLRKEDTLKVNLVISGTVIRGCAVDFDRARIVNTPCTINIRYSDGEMCVGSSTSKNIVDWLSKYKFSGHGKVNNYLSFIEVADTIEIRDITVNDESLVNDFTYLDHLDVAEFVSYISEQSGYDSIKINIYNGTRCVTLIYSNDMFIRFVKVNGKNTLYVNRKNKYNDKFSNYYLGSYSFGSGIPDVTSQIEFYRRVSDVTKSSFNYVLT